MNVTDREGIVSAMNTVRTEWGPITGLIHGAGVIADKEIARKPEDDFAWVFDVKIGGLRALLDATAGDPLKVLVMFASVTARCGIAVATCNNPPCSSTVHGANGCR